MNPMMRSFEFPGTGHTDSDTVFDNDSGLTSDRFKKRPKHSHGYVEEKREEEGEEASAALGGRHDFATLGAAYAAVLTSMKRQVQVAREQNARPQTSLRGDSVVRRWFLTLLTRRMQRDIFIELLQSSGTDAANRMTTLMGAPPYAFLDPGDCSLLRAQGFSAFRNNMTHKYANAIPNYSQFGDVLIVDESGREYRYTQPNSSPPHTPTNVLDIFPASMFGVHTHTHVHGNSRGNGERLEFVVRLKRYSRVQRIQMANSAGEQRALRFPAMGEVLTLAPTVGVARLLGSAGSRKEEREDVQGEEPPPRLRVRVTNIRTAATEGRGNGMASTASILVSLL